MILRLLEFFDDTDVINLFMSDQNLEILLQIC